MSKSSEECGDGVIPVLCMNNMRRTCQAIR